MLDRFDRLINYLRISVTDRCDLRCVYCMPQCGVPLKHHADILSYEQVGAIADEAVALGVVKIRLTGGEPLVRRNIESLVARLSAIEGLRELCMTTNGTRLPEMAATLKDCGLDRVNVSLDSLDESKYREITRGGELQTALRGVDAAVEAGLTPVKINMVVLDSTTEDEVREMHEFCESKGVTLQKILQFSLYDRKDLRRLFHAERPPKCGLCNRLRLTADGFLKPCLFSEHEIRVDFDNIRDSLLEAVGAKPENGSACRNREMCQIGG